MFHYKKVIVIIVGLFIVGCTSNMEISPPIPVAVTAPIPTVAYPAPEGVLVSGNNNLGRIDVGSVNNTNVQIEDHSYRTIYFEDELKKLSDISTYVIFPKNLQNESDMDLRIHKRYKRVLKLVQRLDKVEIEKDGGVSTFYENDNIFILFSNQKDEEVTLANYNYDLANKVLKFFRKTYANSLFREEGPYLITTIKNIWDEKDNFSFLYVNLSRFNKSAVDEIIGAYQERLIKSGIDEVTTFEKWHASLLSFVTNFGSDIQIVQTAVAGGFGD